MKFYNFSFRLGKGNVFPRSLMTRLGRWRLKALLEVCSDGEHKAGDRGQGAGTPEMSRSEQRNRRLAVSLPISTYLIQL